MIRFLDEPQPRSTAIEFVGGPRADERANLDDQPSEIETEGGRYVRSVQCADDGALRYVWRPPDTPAPAP